MIIESISYEDLTDEEKLEAPNNGCGKEDASYIRVTHKNELIALESDAMEQEDTRFYRDLKWIAPLIEKAYFMGKEERGG